jgi:hypothetical protein
MPEEPALVSKSRSHKMHILWAIALVLLLSLGAFCWLVVVPVWRVRSALTRLQACSNVVEWGREVEHEIAELGGPEASARSIRLYL